ncbi:MAG: helix-turn-helix domain-containing protein [Lachnospiraceae bacterium]|nr:helix-turn-helix domain-containing protein [Lachnospiraceae bacterium]
MDILTRLKEFKKTRKLTFEQIATKTNISESTIKSWFRNGTLPDINDLITICKAFDEPITYFLADETTTVFILNKKQQNLLELYESMDINTQNISIKILELLSGAQNGENPTDTV